MSNLCNIPGISTVNEHDTLVADLKLRAEIQKSAPHRVFQWGRAKWSQIRGETRAFATRFCNASGRSVEDQWSSIEKHITKMTEEHVPSKFTKTRTDQPWVTPDLKRKCRKKDRLYKKWKSRTATMVSCQKQKVPTIDLTTTSTVRQRGYRSALNFQKPKI